MPAAVIAHEPIVLRERSNLAVPHVERRGERIRQHQYGRIRWPVDLNIQCAAVDIDHRHLIPFQNLSTLAALRTLVSPPLNAPNLTIDEGLSAALISHQFKQACEFAHGDMAADTQILAQ